MSGATDPLIPKHFRSPVQLALRVWRRGGAQGRFAVWTTSLGIVAVPLDLALRPFEQRLLRAAETPRRPLVLVCGPPRSGTTIASQVLIRHLHVGYVNNLMSVFPRSPLAATRLFGYAEPRNEAVAGVSHYGKTAAFHGPSDGLYLWDRWLGADRTRPCTRLDESRRRDLRRFMAALESLSRRPILNKNNSLNLQAALVGKALPTATFICMRRDPLYLAQSLLVARRYIHADESQPYGVHHPDRNLDDPIDDVCRQVRYHLAAAKAQRVALGADRFWELQYEEFCARPWELIERVAVLLGQDVVATRLRTELQPLEPNNQRTVPQHEFDQLAGQLADIRRDSGVSAC